MGHRKVLSQRHKLMRKRLGDISEMEPLQTLIMMAYWILLASQLVIRAKDGRLKVIP